MQPSNTHPHPCHVSIVPTVFVLTAPNCVGVGVDVDVKVCNEGVTNGRECLSVGG
jgi:hypothetical protein